MISKAIVTFFHNIFFPLYLDKTTSKLGAILIFQCSVFYDHTLPLLLSQNPFLNSPQFLITPGFFSLSLPLQVGLGFPPKWMPAKQADPASPWRQCILALGWLGGRCLFTQLCLSEDNEDHLRELPPCMWGVLLIHSSS